MRIFILFISIFLSFSIIGYLNDESVLDNIIGFLIPTLFFMIPILILDWLFFNYFTKDFINSVTSIITKSKGNPTTKLLFPFQTTTSNIFFFITNFFTIFLSYAMITDLFDTGTTKNDIVWVLLIYFIGLLIIYVTDNKDDAKFNSIGDFFKANDDDDVFKSPDK